MLTGILMTHMAAHREKKPQFFFSRFNLEQIRERGNTHYCFHCGGKWGFAPGENGEATNCLDGRITLIKPDGEYVLIREALENTNLEPHITNSPGYPRRKPEDAQYKAWLEYSADFDYTPEFARWCEESGYTIFRFNPMEDHDPVTHANAVIGNANRFDIASKWLEASITADFPYIVAIT